MVVDQLKWKGLYSTQRVICSVTPRDRGDFGWCVGDTGTVGEMDVDVATGRRHQRCAQKYRCSARKIDDVERQPAGLRVDGRTIQNNSPP